MSERGGPEIPLRLLLVGNPATFRQRNRSLPQPWEDIFGPLRSRHDRRSGRGRPVRPVDRRAHRHPQRALALHQRRGRPCPPASPAGAGRRGGDRGRHRDRRRSAIDRAAGRRPEPGAGHRRSEWPITGDRAGAGSRRYPPAGGHRRRHADELAGRRRDRAAGGDRGRDCPGGDPRGARRARLPPHPGRRRRRHGLALPRRPLPRPAARRGRADHPRRRARRASRCRRSSGSTRRCARRCARTCSATRCCSTAISALSAWPVGRAKMST